jgi:hypothetical protein
MFKYVEHHCTKKLVIKKIKVYFVDSYSYVPWLFPWLRLPSLVSRYILKFPLLLLISSLEYFKAAAAAAAHDDANNKGRRRSRRRMDGSDGIDN